ncbi:MAG: lysylphosphatidylglycerol synthase transmembrane domain-containing protein [candidate division WOR-3 bacterium]
MKNRVKAGLLLFFVFTLSSYILIFFLYVKNFPENLRVNFDIYNIFFIVLFFLLSNLFNILRIYFLGKIFNRNFSFSDGYIFTLGGVLLALITPFQSGGMPFQLFLLSKKGINLGNATSVILMRGFQSIMVLVLTLPFMLFYLQNVFSTEYFRNLITYFIVIYSLILFIIVLIILFNERLKILVEKTFKENPVKKILIKMIEFFSNFTEGVKTIFTKGIKENFLSLLSTFISLYAYFALSFFVIKLFNVKVDFFKAFSLQFLLTYLSAFVPTPGSSGVAESGMALFFSQIVGKENILLYIFIFRLVSTYIPAFLGLFSFLKIKDLWKTVDR